MSEFHQFCEWFQLIICWLWHFHFINFQFVLKEFLIKVCIVSLIFLYFQVGFVVMWEDFTFLCHFCVKIRFRGANHQFYSTNRIFLQSNLKFGVLILISLSQIVFVSHFWLIGVLTAVDWLKLRDFSTFVPNRVLIILFLLHILQWWLWFQCRVFNSF